MENAAYVGLSRQMTLRRELDVVANNIANQDTVGFKVEQLILEEKPESPAKTLGGPAPVKFVLDTGLARDFSHGCPCPLSHPVGGPAAPLPRSLRPDLRNSSPCAAPAPEPG